MTVVDDSRFDCVVKLASIFDEHKNRDNREMSWEEMKAEIEGLSETEMEILLDLVKAKK